jgi:hypothetical protein
VSLWLQLLLTNVFAIVASSGFWAYITSKDKRKDATTQLLMGLSYDKIVTLGMIYIQRGWITKDEYEDYRRYLFEPYKALGGNGVAEKIMDDVSKLPLRSMNKYSQMGPESRDVKELNINERESPGVASGRHRAFDD